MAHDKVLGTDCLPPEILPIWRVDLNIFSKLSRKKGKRWFSTTTAGDELKTTLYKDLTRYELYHSNSKLLKRVFLFRR